MAEIEASFVLQLTQRCYLVPWEKIRDLFFFTVYLQQNTHRSLIVVENSFFLMTLIAKIAALIWEEINCS